MVQGFLFILTNIIIASFQSVFLSHWLKSMNVYFVVAMSFAIVMVLYSSMTLLKGLKYLSILVEMKKNILALNLVSAGNWMFYFFAIRYVNPASVVTITQCLPPVLITLFMLVTRKPVLRSTLFFHSMILLCVILLLRDTLQMSGGEEHDTIIGCGIAILCAITVSMTIGVSKVFANKGLPSYVVLSARFPLLIIISYAMIPSGSVGAVEPTELAIIATIALIGLSLTNYCLQKGIEFSSPMVVSTTLSVSPFVVLLFDKISRHDASITSQTLLIFAIVILSFACIYFSYRSARILNRVAAKAATEC